MTYIVGIRRRDSVFLAADSAITFSTSRPHHGQQRTTSFGEAQLFEQSRSVVEAGLKLHHLGSIAVAVAGDVAQSNRFLAHLRTAIDGHRSLTREIMRNAIEGFDSSDELAFQLLIAMPATPEPLLFSFNAGNDRLFREHVIDEVVQLGSPSEIHVHLLVALLRVFDARLPASQPTAFLVATIAWLHFLGMREYLLERGIGGTFCGVYASQSHVEWQPDVAFGIASRFKGTELAAITMVRDNVLLTHSGSDEASRAMYSSVTSMITVPEWYSRWKSFKDAFLGADIRYVVLIDPVDAQLTVIEVGPSGNSQFLRLEPPTTNANGRLQLAIQFGSRVDAVIAATRKSPPPQSALSILFGWFPVQGQPTIMPLRLTPVDGSDDI